MSALLKLPIEQCGDIVREAPPPAFSSLSQSGIEAAATADISLACGCSGLCLGSLAISPAPTILRPATWSCGAGYSRLTDIALGVMVGAEIVGN
ncbi:hypothetical protein IVB45_05675 [Bradyrhizobium sp. 4]|uniref:hypothetical protein n=1 Tax=unclassified Bradyrhizobium TaxID=2631580 RepID=UPI001FF80C43|nr:MULTISPECIES: hypothetical protein [unclassified Bradyrhizobium]MCK1403852.1 hypothetical protein [Bradyrhizobium sp. 39]MCK1629021.1 hypothetical protein [Bradyrhizobium sp. 162]MCK1751453.1 hypothetical protein [Bradyrhizobium sp. 135]UPJ36421.1 hypothetical protein IVB45_05675 [Bradyrhizobium sp. 4]